MRFVRSKLKAVPVTGLQFVRGFQQPSRGLGESVVNDVHIQRMDRGAFQSRCHSAHHNEFHLVTNRLWNTARNRLVFILFAGFDDQVGKLFHYVQTPSTYPGSLSPVST